MSRHIHITALILFCLILLSGFFACAQTNVAATTPADTAGEQATPEPEASATPAVEPSAASSGGFDVIFDKIAFQDDLVTITFHRLQYVEDKELSLEMTIDRAPGNNYQYSEFVLRINGWSLPLSEHYTPDVYFVPGDANESEAGIVRAELKFSDFTYPIHLSEPREIQLMCSEQEIGDWYTTTYRNLFTDSVVNDAIPVEAEPDYPQGGIALFSDDALSFALLKAEKGMLYSFDNGMAVRVYFDVSVPDESDMSTLYTDGEFIPGTGYQSKCGDDTVIWDNTQTVYDSAACIAFPGTHAIWGLDIKNVLNGNGNPLPIDDWADALKAFTLSIQRSGVQIDTGYYTEQTPFEISFDSFGQIFGEGAGN